MTDVDKKIDLLAAEAGYYVVSRTDQTVELERKNSWFGVVLTAVLSGVSGGGSGSLRRTERLTPISTRTATQPCGSIRRTRARSAALGQD